MRKLTVLFCHEKYENEDGTGELVKTFSEEIVFSEKANDVKKLPGFRSIVTNEYVSHPTPAAMQGAVQFFASNPNEPLSLATFYETCEKAQNELDAYEAELVAKGDPAAVKRAEKKAKAEAEKAKKSKAKRK